MRSLRDRALGSAGIHDRRAGACKLGGDARPVGPAGDERLHRGIGPLGVAHVVGWRLRCVVNDDLHSEAGMRGGGTRPSSRSVVTAFSVSSVPR